MSEIRTVARRDSATSILRKLGVNSRDYSLFIKQTDDGFTVDVELAKKHVAGVEDQKESTPPWDEEKPAKTEKPAKVKKEPKAKKAPKAEKPEKTEKPEKAEKPAKASRTGVSSAIRAMIMDGKSNAEIWESVQKEFNLGDNKRHYPAWYRSQMRRHGELPRQS